MIISIEGIDGSGKRTLGSNLLKLAVAAEVDAQLISFPRYGRSVTSAAISALLASPSKPNADTARFAAALFATERLEALPLLLRGQDPNTLLLIDRYVHSNMAYQGSRAAAEDRAALARWIERLEFDVFGVPRPDLTILIDVAPHTSMARTRARAAEGGRPTDDTYETDDVLQRTARQMYLDMSAAHQQSAWVVTSSDRAAKPEEMASSIWDRQIAPRLGTSSTLSVTDQWS